MHHRYIVRKDRRPPGRHGRLVNFLFAILLLSAAANAFSTAFARETNPASDALSPDVWRKEHRVVDLHMHVEGRPERFERALRIMDAAGVGVGIELGSGTLTPIDGNVSQFEQVKRIADSNHPGRFLCYMLLDYKDWDDAEWSQRAVKQVEKGHELGAAGLKEFKRLGLVLRDGQGKLIRVDDSKLDAVWQRCGELGMPVSIHVADPKAFWEPLEATNERWAELKDHPDWWFGDRKKYPPREELLAALKRVIARHPNTTFVAVHFANNAEDLEWVDQQLSAHPNMMADVAARLPEVGRHSPDKVRKLFVKHQDRILFATDFMVYDRFILGSAGDDERPTDLDALVFYKKCWRFFETDDRDWVHMTPIQGDWTISSINLPAPVLRKIYFDNARKLLSKSWPIPVLKATRISRDFAPDGKLNEEEWRAAAPARVEYALADATAWPNLSTSVRALWTDEYLYLAYEAPYTRLTAAAEPAPAERLGLWDDDVVELFVAPEPENVNAYTEFEWAPNGEQLDVKIDLPAKDFPWQSGMQSVAKVDSQAKIWRVEARIPLQAISSIAPKVGSRWRANLYRNDAANDVFLAWSPTLTNTAHHPQKFGWLEFGDYHEN
jgi:predicted TIM-barrel fold metal-dependent hydrolase